MDVSEPDSWRTIIPLIDLYAGLKTPVCFAGGLLLTPMPDLLRQDKWTERLSASDRRILEGLQYAFVVEYETPPSDHSGPDSDGPERRSIQKAKQEVAVLANFALWLVRPSPVCFDLVFNAPRREGGWCIPFIEKQSRILCHPRDRGGLLSDADLEEARKLHSALCDLPKENSIRTPVYATWSALQIEQAEVRYLLLWIALEALFAPEDARKFTDLLAPRIGRFLSTDHQEAGEVGQEALQSHMLKSRIAYGQTTEQADLSEHSYESETLLRQALRKILSDDDLIKRFSNGKNREAYLNGLTAEI
jgi:hypothetical protein